MKQRLEIINIYDEIHKIIGRNDFKSFILESNKSQLWDGKTKNNTDIRPYYTEDNFFKSKKAALAYANWKSRITKNPNRNPNAPNLYIIGTFYNSLYVNENSKGYVIIDSNIDLGKKITAKFKDVLGLTPKNQSELNKLILPELQNVIKRKI